MNIIKIFNEIKKTMRLYSNRKYMDIKKTCIIDNGFRIEIRNTTKEKIFLKIGEKSIIAGKFIFEKESGKVIIGDNVHIGGSTFISIDEIIIEDDVTIAWDCTFYDHNSHSIYWNERAFDSKQEYLDYINEGNSIKNKNWNVVKHEPIHIGKKVWIGFGCIILKGVKIGEGSVIGAGSVVTSDIPEYTVWAGNPAKFIKKCS
jgi:galactoside O-acetyltransferase